MRVKREKVAGLSGRILAWGLLAGVLGGCSAVPENHYFTMAYSLLPNQRATSHPFPFVVRVRPFDILAAYDTERIVYRYSPYEFQYYNYMLWATKPQRMLTDLLVRHVQHAGLFENVVLEYGDREPDFELTGVIHAVEELDSGKEWFAHLAFSLRMTRFRGEKVVWSRDVDVRKQVYSKSPVYVVKALSELMEEELAKLVADLERMLKGVKPAPTEPPSDASSREGAS